MQLKNFHPVNILNEYLYQFEWGHDIAVVVVVAVIVAIMTKTKKTMSLIKDYYFGSKTTCNLGTIW